MLGILLVEMTISTNNMPNILVGAFENSLVVNLDLLSIKHSAKCRWRVTLIVFCNIGTAFSPADLFCCWIRRHRAKGSYLTLVRVADRIL